VALGVNHKIAEFCQKNSLLAKKAKIVIGVSGGPDSLCLLHLLLTALCNPFELTLIIAHLNHQLRGPDSQADEDFVRETAARWQLPIFVDTCNIATLATKRKQSIEETARQVRYGFLWRVAQETGANKIAVGHNADDQVETVLMHFLRGTGLAGLRGMLPQTDIASLRLHPEETPDPSRQPSPKLIRPLLETSRAEIETYCQENKLSPCRDHSNQDTTFFRNRLRHELIPQLEAYNPNIRQVLQHTAKVVTADAQILSNHLNKTWDFVTKSKTSNKIEFDLPSWLGLPLAMKRSTLRRAVQILRHSLRDINFQHIENAIDILERGGTGTKAILPQGLMLTVGYQTFIIASENTLPYPQDLTSPQLLKDQVVKLNLPGVTPLLHTNWQLRAGLLTHPSLSQQGIKRVGRWEVYLDADIVGNEAILRSRQPGDMFCPLGMAGHRKKVNEFMINEKIPANWRNHIPLLVSKKRVLWVCGYRPDERARLRPTTQRVLHLRFEPQ
jgi:tRNA(Ile)-lysidine synthase